MMTPDERYQRDPLFHTIVDVLEYYIHEAQFSGTELREAAILALIHYEARRMPAPTFLDPATGARLACPDCGEPYMHKRTCPWLGPHRQADAVDPVDRPPTPLPPRETS